MPDNTDREILLSKLAEGVLSTEYGPFKIAYFTDGIDSAIALVHGEIEGQRGLICRIHSSCLFSSAFFSNECNCSDQMRAAMKEIKNNNSGIIIYLFQEGRGNGIPAMISTLNLFHQGKSQIEAFDFKGYLPDRRTYDIAAKILCHHYNVYSVNLISQNIDKIHSLEKYKISVASKVVENQFVTIVSYKNLKTAEYTGKNILPTDQNSGSKIVIVSDLNVDCVCDLKVLNSSSGSNPFQRQLGGCAYNSAIAFKEQGLYPIIIGSVGRDGDGAFIIQELEKNKIRAFISQNDGKTGHCSICYNGDDREIAYDDKNANTYDNRLICASIRLTSLSSSDVVFLTSHLFFRAQTNTKDIFSEINMSNTKIVLDLVPHDLYKKLSFEKISSYITGNIEILISEYKTLCLLLFKEVSSEPDKTIIEEVFKKLGIHYLVLRYGMGEISKEEIWENRWHGPYLKDRHDTGYGNLAPEKRKGFGDILTGRIIKKYIWEKD